MTSSSAGRYGQHGLSAYGASKRAVDGLVRTLASEGAGRGIAVNAVSPYALSQMTAAHIRGEMAEVFTPDRVAPLIAWLASEDCDVTGEVIVAGGGRFRSEEHTSELQSLMRISYAVFCLKKKKKQNIKNRATRYA